MGKIPILYANLEDNDDYATTFGARKGAEVIAALAMNELLHGESNETLTETLKWAAEIALALTLIGLFHWQRTKTWAVLICGFVFTAYWVVGPWFSRWIPDFRSYLLAVGMGFVLEAWLKASGLEGLLKNSLLARRELYPLRTLIEAQHAFVPPRAKHSGRRVRATDLCPIGAVNVVTPRTEISHSWPNASSGPDRRFLPVRFEKGWIRHMTTSRRMADRCRARWQKRAAKSPPPWLPL